MTLQLESSFCLRREHFETLNPMGPKSTRDIITGHQTKNISMPQRRRPSRFGKSRSLNKLQVSCQLTPTTNKSAIAVAKSSPKSKPIYTSARMCLKTRTRRESPARKTICKGNVKGTIKNIWLSTQQRCIGYYPCDTSNFRTGLKHKKNVLKWGHMRCCFTTVRQFAQYFIGIHASRTLRLRRRNIRKYGEFGRVL